jgi:hypothetical protein
VGLIVVFWRFFFFLMVCRSSKQGLFLRDPSGSYHY